MEDEQYRGESEWGQTRQSRGGYGQGSQGGFGQGSYGQGSQGGFGQGSQGGFGQTYRSGGGFSGGPSSQAIGRWGRGEGADYSQQRYSGSYGLGRGGQRGEEQGESFGSKIGRFFGKGPKGYRRSDERIKEELSDRLEEHGEIDASEITVMVTSGEVTLEGTVPDRWMKRMAEDVAEDSAGVKQVHNRLRVEQSNGSETSGSSSSASRDKSTSFGSSSGTTSGASSGMTSGSGSSSSSSGTTSGSDKSRSRSNA